MSFRNVIPVSHKVKLIFHNSQTWCNQYYRINGAAVVSFSTSRSRERSKRERSPGRRGKNVSKLSGVSSRTSKSPQRGKSLLTASTNVTGQSKSVFTPREPKVVDNVGIGAELVGELNRGKVLEVVNQFIRGTEVKKLAAAAGLEADLFTQAVVSFRKHCLQTKELPTELHIILSDLTSGSGHVDDLYPYFWEHAKEIFPHLDMIDDLKRVSDLRLLHERFKEARTIKRKVIFHAGPTNSGKTYHALESFMKSKSGVYCGPLKLLAVEVFEKSNTRGTPCDLVTGEERRYASQSEESPAEHKACTVEMCATNIHNEVAVIDEIQMIKDPARGGAWTRALLGICADEVHLCGEKSAIPIVRELLISVGEELEVRNYERLTSLSVLDYAVEHFDNVRPGDCIVCFSKQEIQSICKKMEELKKECAVIYGSLPPGTKLSQAAKFNEPEDPCNILIATDAIGMGLNLSIKRIIFYGLIKQTMNEKGDLEMDFLSTSAAKQIAGRAGRFGSRYPHGEVTTFKKKDLDILKSILGQEIPEIEQAAIQPTWDIIEMFAYHLPHTSLNSLMDVFIHMCQVNGDHYFLTNLDDFKYLAELLEHIPLRLSTRFTFCLAPVDLRNPFVISMFLKYARRYSQNLPLTIDWLKEATGWPFSTPSSVDDLNHLEGVFDALEIYLWLGYRFPESFLQIQSVHEMKSELDRIIQEGLDSLAHLKTKVGGSDKYDLIDSNVQKKVMDAKKHRKKEEKQLKVPAYASSDVGKWRNLNVALQGKQDEVKKVLVDKAATRQRKSIQKQTRLSNILQSFRSDIRKQKDGPIIYDTTRERVSTKEKSFPIIYNILGVNAAKERDHPVKNETSRETACEEREKSQQQRSVPSGLGSASTREQHHFGRSNRTHTEGFEQNKGHVKQSRVEKEVDVDSDRLLKVGSRLSSEGTGIHEVKGSGGKKSVPSLRGLMSTWLHPSEVDKKSKSSSPDSSSRKIGLDAVSSHSSHSVLETGEAKQSKEVSGVMEKTPSLETSDTEVKSHQKKSAFSLWQEVKGFWKYFRNTANRNALDAVKPEVSSEPTGGKRTVTDEPEIVEQQSGKSPVDEHSKQTGKLRIDVHSKQAEEEKSDSCQLKSSRTEESQCLDMDESRSESKDDYFADLFRCMAEEQKKEQNENKNVQKGKTKVVFGQIRDKNIRKAAENKTVKMRPSLLTETWKSVSKDNTSKKRYIEQGKKVMKRRCKTREKPVKSKNVEVENFQTDYEPIVTFSELINVGHDTESVQASSDKKKTETGFGNGLVKDKSLHTNAVETNAKETDKSLHTNAVATNFSRMRSSENLLEEAIVTAQIHGFDIDLKDPCLKEKASEILDSCSVEISEVETISSQNHGVEKQNLTSNGKISEELLKKGIISEEILERLKAEFEAEKKSTDID